MAEYAIAKTDIGRKTFERYLTRTGFEVDFSSLKRSIKVYICCSSWTLLLASKTEIVPTSVSLTADLAEIYPRTPTRVIWAGDKRKILLEQTSIVARPGVGVV